MNKRLGDKKGITLVALVITVIILLILAGIAISVLGGENGLFAKAKQAKEKYDIAEAKEKIELAIAGLRIEEEGKGEELTKEDLPKINNDEMDVRDTTSFPVEVICGIYKFEVDENFVVTYIGEADGTIITYTTEPEGYTNKDEIKILIKVRNPKGIKTIEYPNGDKVEIGGATERETDYTVTVNGTYIFKVIDSDNKEITKDIEVDKIDKLEPIDFIPEIKKEGNSITIIENGEDAEADEINTKSGIDYYEYYLEDENKNTTKYDTNKIENLEIGTYQVYVIVYDKAGNSKESNKVEVKISMQFDKISAGEYSSFAIDKEGNLWKTGYNYSTLIENLNTLKLTKIYDGIKFKDVKTENNNTLAIDIDGSLYSCGFNTYGQLGDGNKANEVFDLRKIEPENKFKEIALRDGLSRAIDIEGNIWSFGYRLYIGADIKKDTLVPIHIDIGTKAKKIEVGGSVDNGWNFSIVLDEEGNLWSWGFNAYGQLGDGTNKNSISPKKIDTGDVKFQEISAGENHSLALDEEGNLWSWGFNTYGQLGDGTNKNSISPKKIDTGDVKFQEISARENHSLALDEEGNLWSWGFNTYGQLGDGTNKNSISPKKIDTGNVKFQEISAGDTHSLALDENGNLWGWGKGANGQLGNGKNENLTVPTQI